MASSTCYREQDRAFNKGEEAVRFLKHLMRRRRIPRGKLLVTYGVALLGALACCHPLEGHLFTYRRQIASRENAARGVLLDDT
jgi:hypothetical protein